MNSPPIARVLRAERAMPVPEPGKSKDTLLTLFDFHMPSNSLHLLAFATMQEPAPSHGGDDAMARRSTKNTIAALWFILLLAFWPFALIALIILVFLRWRRRCGVCRCALTGAVYDWTIDGKSVRACTECNKRMRAKVSKAAVDELYASGSSPAPK